MGGKLLIHWYMSVTISEYDRQFLKESLIAFLMSSRAPVIGS
jgi:hypothetical protein